ncbi:uncharacterized protein C8Q71DRAFT_107219 [Rhodofomes roseus]|uniref:Uncharacterized protein n=1 Tax=Rhodofomes roseus TaxID=34475 RepID=A0ABQ8KCF7_9APHY|nr:uncharacterized protein C8Q71DRAFT_107219 [Rhodofomes roseus]KAH9835175.1 hypothetical protein C8Q71DRAFT_107219 [Rhodofomes roseus]
MARMGIYIYAVSLSGKPQSWNVAHPVDYSRCPRVATRVATRRGPPARGPVTRREVQSKVALGPPATSRRAITYPYSPTSIRNPRTQSPIQLKITMSQTIHRSPSFMKATSVKARELKDAALLLHFHRRAAEADVIPKRTYATERKQRTTPSMRERTLASAAKVRDSSRPHTRSVVAHKEANEPRRSARIQERTKRTESNIGGAAIEDTTGMARGIYSPEDWG